MLAALREIYDGSWHRDVGRDGGRRLHWEGRVGLLAGAPRPFSTNTTASWPNSASASCSTGSPSLDARSQGHASLAHHGRERAMRRELADAVAGLFAGLDLSEPPAADPGGHRPARRSRRSRVAGPLTRHPRQLPARDRARARQRSSRPYCWCSRSHSDRPSPDRGREGEAWRLTVKTGLDSMPAARLQTLEFLLDHDNDSDHDRRRDRAWPPEPDCAPHPRRPRGARRTRTRIARPGKA